MNVIKRNGQEVVFNLDKIESAIAKANKDVAPQDQIDGLGIINIATAVDGECQNLKRAVNVEEIQDFVEDTLLEMGYYRLAKAYMTYRYQHALMRQTNTTDGKILSLINLENEEIKQENSNKNPVIVSTQRDYMAGEVSKDLSKRYLLPPDIIEAHNKGIIHFHDMDYFAQHIHNCDLINLEDMLQNGTIISGTLIEKPHSFATACNIATQIVAQVASCQYGGQTFTMSHLAPFVDISRQKIKQEVEKEFKEIYKLEDIDQEKINEIVESRVKTEIKRGIQTIQYQINTLMTTNGQSPFVSVNLYLHEVPEGRTRDDLALIIEEVFKQRIQGTKNAQGIWITPAFPKLLYVLEEDNINPKGKYYYLTRLAAKCTAKRMVPDYISEKKMLELKGDCYPCMGCRSFLTPDRFTDKGLGNIAKAKTDSTKHKYYGRWNQGVVTINLVDVACSAAQDIDKFWSILDERLELCHRALRCRHERLRGTPSDVAPILWQNGALARLKPGEVIDPLLYNGYSTISLGYAGLWECVYCMTNHKLTEKEGHDFGIQIMKKLNEYTAKWKAAENIDYSLYGTPMESTTYKFAKCLQDRFGIIKGVTDKNYITNSYHVKVTEPIDAFDKLKLESEFQELSPGGAISYVEVPNLQNNIDAVLEVITFIYNNIMYAELNTKSDYCQVCGFSGEIEIKENEHHKLVWTCPCCGNQDHTKMNIARRVCGYISTNDMNQGRIQEIKERVLHL